MFTKFLQIFKKENRQPSPENPLQNELVIRTIFQKGPQTLDSVKTHRLVCKAWKFALDSEWYSLTVPVTIFQDEELCEKQDKTMLEKTTTLSQFLETESTSIHPQKNFVLEKWDIKREHYTGSDSSGGGGDNVEDLNRSFWNKHGKNVSILTLSHCKLPWSRQLLEDSLLAILPNLERVSLLNCTLEGEPEDHSIILFHQLNAPLHGGVMLPSRFVRAWRQSIEMQKNRLPLNGVLDNQQENPAEVVVAPPPPQPLKLRNLRADKVLSLRVHNVKVKPFGVPVVLDWQKLLYKFSNVEEISVRDQPLNSRSLATALKQSNVEKKLKKLDIMHASVGDRANCTLLALNWRNIRLQKLTIDCHNYPNQELVLREVLKTQSSSLTELHLYSATLTSPNVHYLSTLCDMPNLVQLHFWGVMSGNLDFLKRMPKLNVLKWKTVLSEESSYDCVPLAGGRKIYKRYNRQYADGLVMDTNGLPPHFQLKSMRVLEFERGPMSLECWQQLGEWMPGLTKLKCMVVNDEHFALIGKLWPKLKHLEMTHGTRLSSGGMLQAVSKGKSFKQLETVIWKTCSCLQERAKEKKLWDENETERVEKELEKRARNESVILPWKSNGLDGEPITDDDCLQLFYESITLFQPILAEKPLGR